MDRHETSETSKTSKTTKHRPHPYLHGNFAPIRRTQPLTPCSYAGTIPEELAGGEYVRNGGNPVTSEELGRDAHWFDGDGMLSGVAFRRQDDGSIQPEFVTQYILTDVYLSTITTPSLRSPILPSISTLVNPASSLIFIIFRVFRTLFLVILSKLPGSQQSIKKISVANTAILYHDGRALATCESGIPMRVSLPGLETVGWYDGRRAEGEPWTGEESTEDAPEPPFGGDGLLGFMKEWTTAHPRVDPVTKEMILFHSIFFPPYINYSIIPSTHRVPLLQRRPRMVNQGVPGVKSPKMMHDFGVSATHTIIMDLPLSLDPFNLARNRPVVSYDPTGTSRFGIFPRYHPSAVRWFETNPCCIFHTANAWDEVTPSPTTKIPQTTAVNLLACRLTSASLVFSAGNIAAPAPIAPLHPGKYAFEPEQCRLYYYRFSLAHFSNVITHQFALAAISFEFPSLHPSRSMSPARYVYGCSVSDGTFGAALGRGMKIDLIVKMDVDTLLARAQEHPPTPITGCVDQRSIDEILQSSDPDDPIKMFRCPPGVYAQESRFVPRRNAESEDDGYIVFYTFDESQLDLDGEASSDARSELWVVDARNMTDVVCRVQLPQRVPYGLHGSWFSEEEVLSQRVVEKVRGLPKGFIREMASGNNERDAESGIARSTWVNVRRWLLEAVG